MKKGILVISILFTLIFSQEKFELKGRIIDSETGKPLDYVNVLLSYTTIGAATLEDGSFHIKNIPAGSYEILFSCVGYEKTSKYVELTKNHEFEKPILLVKKSYETELINVQAKEDKDWQENFKQFRDWFLGLTPNSEHCTIKNSYKIDFSVQDAIFKAKCRELIEVENRALGFIVSIDLKDFSWDRTKRETKMNYVPYFRHITTTNQDTLNMWEENRRIAYNGSVLHFFKSLVDNKLADEGFIVWPAVENIGDRKIQNVVVATGKEVTRKWNNNIIVGKDKDVVSAAVSGSYIVIYNLENYDENYKYFVSTLAFRDHKFQVSTIEFLFDKMIFQSNGSALSYNPYYKLGPGYWNYERVADYIPLDYVF